MLCRLRYAIGIALGQDIALSDTGKTISTGKNLDKTIRILHILVASSAVIACVVLAFATEGHPPGIVFIPFVVAYWVIAHLLLIGIKWLLAYMAKPKQHATMSGWPPLLTLLMLGSGLILLPMIYGLFHDMVIRGKWPELSSWLWALVIFMPPASLLGGIVFGAMTGSKYARWIAATGPLAYVGYIVYRLAKEIAAKGFTNESWFNVIVVVGVCVATVWYLLSSENVKAFFASRQ